MAIALIIVGLFLSLAGLVGSILPGVPGPPLGFFALVILSLAKHWEPFGPTFLIIMALLTAAATILDFVVPVAWARKHGASKSAIWGSIGGLVIGFFLFPPWGILLGPFLGALVGEAVSGKTGRRVLRSGWGALVGTLLGTGLKLALSGVMLFFYVKEMF